MKRLGWSILAMIVLGSFLVGLFATGAGSQAPTGQTANAYTTTFLCGTFREGKAEGPVSAGEYRTVITIRNPNADPATITERAVLLVRGAKETSRVRRAGAGVSVTLPGRAGTQIDCTDIRQGLLSGPKAPTFAEGLVTVEVDSPANLDVVGLTTVVRDGEVNTVAVDRPGPEQVTKTSSTSSPRPTAGPSSPSSPRPTAGPSAGPSPSPSGPSGGLIPGL